MKVFIKIFQFITISILIFMIGLYGICYIYEKPPIFQGHYVKMLDSDSSLFYQSHQQSDDVLLKDISPHFTTSIIAIEDHRFYEHKGFDVIGIMRAIKTNLLNQSPSQGASTISQQYARLLFLTNEKTWSRKIKEAILAIRLEVHYDKDTLLQGYMNTVYFGHGIYGIKNAAIYYFNKEPKDLDLNESTMLAGVINGPGYYSPFIDMKAAKQRQKIVLNRLVELKHISKEKADEVYNTPYQLNKTKSTLMSSFPYYKDTVIEELKELGFYKEEYINKGINVKTTLNRQIQHKLNQVIEKNMKDKDDLEVSSMVVDSEDGSILALTGGKDYSSSQFNRATQASRQVASTIKPLLYYIALENGFSPTTKFKSEKTTFQLANGETYSPQNFSHKYANSQITLAQAIAVSDNIYAIKTHLFLGEQALVNKLNSFGFKNIAPHPSLALGTLNTNIYQLASIYTTFANTGVYNDIHTIDTITLDDGTILYQHTDRNEQLLNKEDCLILNQLLTSPFKKEFDSYASATMKSYPVNTTFATKTGTSPFDSLCVGYNPQYTLLNWVGYDDNHDLNLSTHKRVPKILFQQMANYLQSEELWYDQGDFNRVPIHPFTGEYNDQGLIYWFKD